VTDDFSAILAAAERGEPLAAERLLPLVYDQLRAMAAKALAAESPGQTLTPTALVHEAWLKLAGSLSIAPASRLHFKRIAARAMRQVLVEAARRRKADKRGGDVAMVTFDEDAGYPSTSADDLLLLDAALEDLARVNSRQAVMVESRFFGGLDVAETAQLLQISEATVLRDWRAAKAWLSSELRRG
jgi:RNA polymerase sigma factor (TIGR02999 family)